VHQDPEAGRLKPADGPVEQQQVLESATTPSPVRERSIAQVRAIASATP
jgi:hypothetical protein